MDGVLKYQYTYLLWILKTNNIQTNNINTQHIKLLFSSVALFEMAWFVLPYYGFNWIVVIRFGVE